MQDFQTPRWDSGLLLGLAPPGERLSHPSARFANVADVLG
jgi:hypothetical protein